MQLCVFVVNVMGKYINNYKKQFLSLDKLSLVIWTVVGPVLKVMSLQ